MKPFTTVGRITNLHQKTLKIVDFVKKATLSAALLMLVAGLARAQETTVPTPFVTLTDLEEATYPYALTQEQATAVLAHEHLTIAMDVTMGDTGSDQAWVCASDTSVTSDNTKYDNTSTFVAIGSNGGKVRLYASARSGGYYTANAVQLTAVKRHKVVVVMTASERTVYVDGVAASTTQFQDFHHLATNENAHIYIGGGKNSAGAMYGFNGKVHSVQFFDSALTTDEITGIEYPVTKYIANHPIRVYVPVRRVTTLEPGKRYMIYNTTITNQDDRTGLLYDTGTSIGHSGSPKKKPSTWATTEGAYLWEVVATNDTDNEHIYYLRAANGGYVSATGKTNNTEAQAIYIQPWATSQAPKAPVKSEGPDGAVHEGDAIGEGVWTICGTSATSNRLTGAYGDCWNGNPDTWTHWGNSHPYAFYEVATGTEMPTPGVKYYIAADALQPDGSYTRHYLYNDNGTLATSTTPSTDTDSYLWMPRSTTGGYNFANVAGGHLGYGNSGLGLTIADSPVTLTLSAADAKHKGSLGMMRMRPSGDNAGAWMVTHATGGSFNRNGSAINDATWTSDYVFIAQKAVTTDITCTINEYEIATFYANHATIIPDAVTAYVATDSPMMTDSEGVITMTRINDGIIPAKTGVVIRGEAGTYTFTSADTEGTTVANNLMRGYDGDAAYETVAMPQDGTTNYVLTVMNGIAGFYKNEAAFDVYRNKAYLQVPATETLALAIRFGDHDYLDTTTGIEAVPHAAASSIVHDLMGRRVTHPTKGIYIVNGKKRVMR